MSGVASTAHAAGCAPAQAWAGLAAALLPFDDLSLDFAACRGMDERHLGVCELWVGEVESIIEGWEEVGGMPGQGHTRTANNFTQ